MPVKTLERRLGLPSVVAISVGAMLGSGLFVLPGLAIGMTGPSLWIAYLLAGLCVLPAALSKAELGTAMPVSGGTYVYIDRTFGPLAGTVAGLGLWFALLLKSAFALDGLSAYLSVIADFPLKTTALTLLLFITFLNILGVRRVGRVQVWVVGFAFAGLWLLAGWGGVTFDESLYANPFPHGGMGLIEATAFVYISYAGVTKVAAIAEEVQNPGRNIPAGILVALFAVIVTYCVTTFVLAGNVPEADLDGNLRPIYVFAETIGGHTLGVMAAVLGIVTMASMANAGVLASSRFPFAMSRDHLLPSIIRWVHPDFKTPVAGIALTALVMGGAILVFDVARIAKLASAMQMVAFAAENATVIILRETSSRWYQPSYRSPLYPWMQGFGILTALGLLFAMGLTGLAALMAMAVPGVLIYFIYGRPRANRRGVVETIGPRQDLLAKRPVDLMDALPGEAAVVVPLLGEERSPETVVEVGLALSDNRRVEVLHLTDIPEQTMLDAMLEEDARVVSLRRRIEAMADAHNHDVLFDAVVTRDVIHTMDDVSSRLHCHWLVMEWQGQGGRDIFQFNAFGWLLNNLRCNLALFKDVGIRHHKEILVLPAPGPHDALVVDTADHLAELWGANLTLARYVPQSAPGHRDATETAYLDQLAELCHRSPARRLIHGSKMLDTLARETSAYDMLVTGAPPDKGLWDILRGTPEDRLTRRAACSVLRVKTPRERTHEGMGRARHKTGDQVRIVNFIEPRCVRAKMDPSAKTQLFSVFARTFAEALDGLTPAEVEAALWERERAQNTAVGRGVALPHATLDAVEGPVIGIFQLRQAADYQAPDGQPVDVCFVTLGPQSARNVHLQILARLAKLVLQTPLLEQVHAAGCPEEIVEAVRRCEPLVP